VAIVDDLYRGRRQNVGEGAAYYELDVSRVGFVGVHRDIPLSAAYGSQDAYTTLEITHRPKARPKLAR
jgi:hypothetical protein